MLLLEIWSSARGPVPSNHQVSGPPKNCYNILVQILYRLVHCTQSAFHECNCRSFLHPCNPSRKLLTAKKFNWNSFCAKKNHFFFAVQTVLRWLLNQNFVWCSEDIIGWQSLGKRNFMCENHHLYVVLYMSSHMTLHFSKGFALSHWDWLES